MANVWQNARVEYSLIVLQDKVGPIARSAADAAVVLDIIRAADPANSSSRDTPLEDPFSLQSC